MPTTLAFTEAKIKVLKPPEGRDREYHKDSKFPGLQPRPLPGVLGAAGDKAEGPAGREFRP